MNTGTDQWLEAVYSARSESELMKGYSDWARDYDQDLMRYGYRLPPIAAGMVARHVANDDAPLLDAGCGTGLVGEALHAIGYGDLTGIDLSDQMLAVAGAKKVYRALHQMRLGDALDLPSDHFSAIVSIGTFTVGHAGPEGFDELIRITRPGGHIIVSIRTDINPDNPHLDRMKEIEADGGWRHVESSREVVTMPWEDANVRNTVLVFQRPA